MINGKTYYYVNIPRYGSTITWRKLTPIIEFSREGGDEIELQEGRNKDQIVRIDRKERGFKRTYAGYLGKDFFDDWKSARKELLRRSGQLIKSLQREIEKLTEFREELKKGGKK